MVKVDSMIVERQRKSGFTLIELSIVLVIIGLLVGGVLTGRDLIHAAEIRSAVSDIEKYNTAIMTFRNKYNCLPGDCANAAQFWGQMSDCVAGALDGTTCNGNGNGFINAPGDDNSEYSLFWQHLALAHLISGSYSGGSPPYNDGITDHHVTYLRPVSRLDAIEYYFGYVAIDPVSTSFYIEPAHYYLLDGLTDAGDGFLLTPDVGFAIDNKLDDGKPGTGIMREPVIDDLCYTTTDAATSVYNIAGQSEQRVCTRFFIKAPL